MSNTNTNLTYTTQCNDAGGASHSVSQADPSFRFYIRPSQPCAARHESHLDYGGHTHVHITDFVVPGDTLTLVFPWRSRNREEIIISPVKDVLEESVNRKDYETSYVLSVPPAGEERTWYLSGGSPGFALRVRVKRS